MNLWPFKRAEKRDTDPSWSALINRGALSASGQFVDANAAESLTAVFAAVQALSESTATLPLHVYQRQDDGERVRADEHPLSRVLRQPNECQTGVAFRESMTASVLLHGNAYARIETNAAGELTALHPIPTREVSVIKLPSGRWAYDLPNGERLLPHELFHLADRTEPGDIAGRSRIAIARDQLGLSLAQREHGAAVFKNGAMPSGVLETPNRLDEKQVSRIAEQWQARHGGAANHGRTPVLEWGLSYKPLSTTLEDLQWISAQKLAVEDVARIFRIPPTMIQDLSHSTYTNVIELGSQFVRYSLARWIAMWEAEISRQLLGPVARRRYLAEHSVEGLLRGAPETRAAFYASAIAAGWMTVNEVRRLENLPALEVSDVDND
ncbi:phage portal protein [Xanthomonas sp. 3058]|uniref:phage portal protein n=1 Tax=Xanthomonas sp. 3058 TaxID=3035314 RepID=UPI0016092F1B|nr:phage portal protein [Xanthomonas sp. 3058]MBB5862418.1 HK97 family phage portal protein [Xanthomonas sp. 3058]